MVCRRWTDMISVKFLNNLITLISSMIHTNAHKNPWNYLIDFAHGLGHQTLDPIIICSVHTQITESDAKSKRRWSWYVVFIAYVYISNFNLHVVYNLCGEFFGECQICFRFVYNENKWLNCVQSNIYNTLTPLSFHLLGQLHSFQLHLFGLLDRFLLLISIELYWIIWYC